MTVTNSALGVISIDDSGGTPRNISGQVTSATLNEGKNVGSYHTIDSEWEKQSEGGRNWRVELEFLETQSSNEAHQLMRDWSSAARTFTGDSPDSQVGSLRYTGEVVRGPINSLTQKRAGSGDPVKSTVTLMGHSTLTKSVIT